MADQFAAEICTIPILYKSVRDWLIVNGDDLPPHSTRRVIMYFTVNLYVEY